MPQLHISKSIQIQASPELVFARVCDFKQWPAWSPWLCAEPDCPLTFANDGSSYSWDGKWIGSGSLTRVEATEQERLVCQLEMLKPWKSTSEVIFTLVPAEGGTEITWTMNGSLPFYLFFLKGMMTCMVGMDYARGLRMLKEYVETGTVISQIEYPGQESVGEMEYIGVRNQCKITELESTMLDDFNKLFQWYDSQDVEASGRPFTAYHKWKFGNGSCEYTIGLPFEPDAVVVPPGFVNDRIPACQAFIVRYTGPYRNLGNAWAAGMARQQAQVFAADKKIPPFEIYENDPRETPENELVTRLCFPVRQVRSRTS
ncbi:MAG: SRPBCC family protein [Verrucomicrobiota bacterium]